MAGHYGELNEEQTRIWEGCSAAAKLSILVVGLPLVPPVARRPSFSHSPLHTTQRPSRAWSAVQVERAQLKPEFFS